MTAPWPDPPQLPNPPHTVQLKPCCGLLAGDVCACAELWAETVAAFANPIRWHATPDGMEATR